ncbi:MAG: SGNH/GDSL hydrolase family protein [Clostridiales Family XIII bacterium]|jgi:hypothetical protein|nr:SGNH/GDSL hydrolase family protein [Clostridiales Family XIII bacterium]
MKPLHICIATVVLLICFLSAQRLLTPKYMESLHEGALTAEYYADEKDNAVLFIGDCEVYENFSPVKLWTEYGISSYIRGGPQQLIWQSYYLLLDTLRYETPEVVVFNVLSMKYAAPQSEAYNRLNLDGMRLSSAKLGAILASVTPEETVLSYIFPIFRFHDRWDELTAEDLRYFAARESVGHNGYYMRNDTKPVGIIPEGPKLADYRFGENSYSYLDKITALCESKGIDLLLIKAPTIYPHWYSEWDAQMQSYADEHGLFFVNFLAHTEEIGLDFRKDTYDGGLHLNRSGAEKLTDYLGKLLADRYGLADRRGDASVAAIWREKTRDYEAAAQAQMREIETYGEIRTFTYRKNKEVQQ